MESLVNTYKRESQRQKLLVKKARVCEAKLLVRGDGLRQAVGG